MTDNELTDELAKELELGTADKDEMKKAATILRQQQGEKDEYIKSLKHMASRIAKYYDEIKVLKETLKGRDRYIDLLMESHEKRIDNENL